MTNEKYLKEKYNNENTLFIKEKICPNGLDLVAYDITGLPVKTEKEFFKYVSDSGQDEESYELDRVTLIEIIEELGDYELIADSDLDEILDTWDNGYTYGTLQEVKDDISEMEQNDMPYTICQTYKVINSENFCILTY